MSTDNGKIVLALTLNTIVETLAEQYEIAFNLHQELTNSGDELAAQSEGLVKGFGKSAELVMEMGKKALTSYDTLAGYVAQSGLSKQDTSVGGYL